MVVSLQNLTACLPGWQGVVRVLTVCVCVSGEHTGRALAAGQEDTRHQAGLTLFIMSSRTRALAPNISSEN